MINSTPYFLLTWTSQNAHKICFRIDADTFLLFHKIPNIGFSGWVPLTSLHPFPCAAENNTENTIQYNEQPIKMPKHARHFPKWSLRVFVSHFIIIAVVPSISILFLPWIAEQPYAWKWNVLFKVLSFVNGYVMAAIRSYRVQNALFTPCANCGMEYCCIENNREIDRIRICRTEWGTLPTYTSIQLTQKSITKHS